MIFFYPVFPQINIGKFCSDPIIDRIIIVLLKKTDPSLPSSENELVLIFSCKAMSPSVFRHTRVKSAVVVLHETPLTSFASENVPGDQNNL